MSDPLLLTAAEAAARLGVKEDWLRRHVTKDGIPHRRVGRLLRFTEDDLAAYVESTKVRSANPYRTTRSR